MHRIRLAGFWSSAPLPDGRVRHARRFGRPRTLDPGETAWLVGTGPAGSGMIWLNGALLGDVTADEPFAFDVTTRLQPRNEVWIDGSAAQIDHVVLEIRTE
jgi:hypothetical protein